MKRYILIGVHRKEGLEKQVKCIDTILEENDKLAYGNLGDYVWEYHKENIEKYDILFLVSNELKIIARASSFADVEFMKMAIKNDEDLLEYHPVYVDIAEQDERVLLSEVLDVDLV